VAWAGNSPTCVGVDCGSLTGTLSNGEVQHASTRHPNAATYTCNIGYELVGAPTRACSVSATWAGSAPSCRGKTCAAASGPNNGGVSVSNGGRYPSTATYTCNTGYELNGDASSACIAATLRWDGATPTCLGRSCEVLSSPSNGAVTRSNSGLFPSTATYTCDIGYERLAGDVSRSCVGASGNYGGAAMTCQGKVCQPLTAPSNGAMSVAASVRYPATVEYTCEPGYELTGTASASCGTNTEWSSVAPTCNACGVDTFKVGTAAGSKCQDCQAFSSTNGQLGQSECLCNAGFELKDGKCERCAVNFFKAGAVGSCTACAPGYEAPLTGSTQCQGIACSALPGITFGSRSTSNSNSYPSSGTYVCDLGYALDEADDGVRSCQTDGSWSGSPANCNPICGDGEPCSRNAIKIRCLISDGNFASRSACRGRGV